MLPGGCNRDCYCCCDCCDAMSTPPATAPSPSPSIRHRRRRRPAAVALASAALGVAAVSLLAGSAATAEALELQLAHGAGHRLRHRSSDDLQQWAVAERQRLVGRYGPAAAGLAQGLQPLKRKRDSDSEHYYHQNDARQVNVEPSGSISRAASAAASSGARPAATSTAVSVPNNRTINPRTGYANLTNYQSDLSVQL